MSDSDERHLPFRRPLSERPLSRRKFFPTVFGASAVLTAALSAGNEVANAQPKLSQQTAKYQNHPNNGQDCDDCQHFRPPNSCQLVEGNIDPHGWCMLFAKKAE